MLIQDLQKIGLSENEAKIYLANLELGVSPLAKIAQKSGILRTTAYSVMELLTKKGIASSFEKNKKQYFGVEGPEVFKEMIKVSEDQLMEQKVIAQRIYSELKSLDNMDTSKPAVRFYEGKAGLETIRKEYLKSNPHTTFSIFCQDNVDAIFQKSEGTQQLSSRLDKNIKCKLIYTSSFNYDYNNPLTISKKIPKERFDLPAEIVVADDKVFFINLRDFLSGVVIESPSIATTMKSLFTLALEAAEKYSDEEKKKGKER